MVVQKPMAAYVTLLSKQAHGVSARIASLVDTACQYAGQGVSLLLDPANWLWKLSSCSNDSNTTIWIKGMCGRQSINTLCFQETSNLHWSTLIWVTYNRQTIRRIPRTKTSYTHRCTKHEVRVSVEHPHGLTSPSAPHHHGTSIELPNSSRPKESCSKKCHAQRNGCSSFRRIMSRAQRSSNGDVGAPQCWLRVPVQHHTKFHNELWGFYARNTIDSFNWTLSLASGPLKQYNIKDLKRW